MPVVRISLTEGRRGTEWQAHAPVESVGVGHGQAGEGRGLAGGESTRLTNVSRCFSAHQTAPKIQHLG